MESSLRMRNLGVVDAIYGVEYDNLVREMTRQTGNRDLASAAIRTSYASMMDYLLKHPEVELTGDPKQFVRGHVLRAAMVKVQSSPLARAALANGRMRRARRNSEDDEGEKELEGYSYSYLKPLIQRAMRDNISVLVRGSPGIGKSALATELAKEANLQLIDIRLAQKDPTELGGIYFPIVEKGQEYGQMRLFPPDWAIMASKQACLIFLDEINAATSKAQQAAAYQIVLERRVGNTHFHDDTKVIAAGNLSSDKAIVTPLSSALNNRFLHFVMKVDLDSWLEWAKKIKNGNTNVDLSIIAYFEGKKQSEGTEGAVKHLFNNDGRYVAFPSPRSWDIASKVLRSMEGGANNRINYDALQTMIFGCIGPDEGSKFLSFYRFAKATEQWIPKILERGLPPDFFIRQYTPSTGQLEAVDGRFASMSGLFDYLMTHDLEDHQIRNLANALKLAANGGSYEGNDYLPSPDVVQLVLGRLWRSEKQDLVSKLCQTGGMKEIARSIADGQMTIIKQKSSRGNPRYRMLVSHGSKTRKPRRPRGGGGR
jgi:DNA replication protein DnaC